MTGKYNFHQTLRMVEENCLGNEEDNDDQSQPQKKGAWDAGQLPKKLKDCQQATKSEAATCIHAELHKHCKPQMWYDYFILCFW